MPRSQTAQIIDGLIRDFVHPTLKPVGFRRQGRTWNRAVNDVVHVMNVQGSDSNYGDTGKFTINMGVYVPSAHRYLWGFPQKQFVTEPLCMIRQRPAQLAYGRDHWWSFDSTTDLAQLGDDVRSAIVRHALPFLAPLDSIAAVLAHCAGHWPARGVDQAVCSFLVGDTLAAVDALVQAIRRDVEHGFREDLARARRDYVLNIAARLGPDIKAAVVERVTSPG